MTEEFNFDAALDEAASVAAKELAISMPEVPIKPSATVAGTDTSDQGILSVAKKSKETSDVDTSGVVKIRKRKSVAASPTKKTDTEKAKKPAAKTKAAAASIATPAADSVSAPSVLDNLQANLSAAVDGAVQSVIDQKTGIELDAADGKRFDPNMTLYALTQLFDNGLRLNSEQIKQLSDDAIWEYYRTSDPELIQKIFDAVEPISTDISGPYLRGEIEFDEMVARARARNEAEAIGASPEPMPAGLDVPVTPEEAGAQKQAEIALLEMQIKNLEEELDGVRMAYAKKDYEQSGVWKRLTRFFGKELKPTEPAKEEELYKEKLQQILDKKIELLKKSEKKGNELKDAMAVELQYFSTESKIHLYDAWTEAKGGGGVFARFGKRYNNLAKKHPFVMGGVGLALLGSGLAFGGAVPATLTAAVFIKRALATPGLFVTADTAIGGAAGFFRKRGIKNQAILDSGELIGLGSHELEASADQLSEHLKKLVGSVDKDLQGRKVSGKIQSATAFLLSATLFSSAAVNAFEHLTAGSDGAADVVVERAAAAKAAAGPSSDAASGAVDIKPVDINTVFQNPSQNFLDPMTLPENGPLPAFTQIGINSPAPSAETLAEIARAESIDKFIHNDITVKKGDSVWKISARMADQFKLEGAQRTHFIDALKDKFGDVQLKEGQVINMGKEGISKEYIENALGKSASLTESQMASISANDAKIAAFASENPNVTLTEQVIEKEILHPQHGGGIHATDTHSRILDSRKDDGFQRLAVFDAPSDSPAPAASAVETASTATSTAEKLGDFKLERSNDWSQQIFAMAPNDELTSSAKTYREVQGIKIVDIQKDIQELLAGKVYADGQIGAKTKLTGWQMKNFADFSSGKNENLRLAAYFRELPREEHSRATLGGYLKYVAEKAENSTRLGRSGLFTTSIPRA